MSDHRDLQVSEAGSDSGTIAAGKFRLPYRIEGTGTPTIVTGSATLYPRVFSQNPRKHLRLVFLEHRAFASSPSPVDMAEIAWETTIDDVERARKEFGLGRVAVDIAQGLATFDRPVFLAFGHYDFLVAPPSAWDPIRPKFRDLTVRVFERSGHFPQYEEADLFDAKLLRWMKGP